MRLPNADVMYSAYLWKDSVNVLTVTHALTKRSKVIPGGGPYPVTGWEADQMTILTNS